MGQSMSVTRTVRMCSFLEKPISLLNFNKEPLFSKLKLLFSKKKHPIKPWINSLPKENNKNKSKECNVKCNGELSQKNSKN